MLPESPETCSQQASYMFAASTWECHRSSSALSTQHRPHHLVPAHPMFRRSVAPKSPRIQASAAFQRGTKTRPVPPEQAGGGSHLLLFHVVPWRHKAIPSTLAHNGSRSTPLALAGPAARSAGAEWYPLSALAGCLGEGPPTCSTHPKTVELRLPIGASEVSVDGAGMTHTGRGTVPSNARHGAAEFVRIC